MRKPQNKRNQSKLQKKKKLLLQKIQKKISRIKQGSLTTRI
jgi:hypothetical protein